MPKKPSQRLVVDASVARASGGADATYPTSKHCRDFLDVVRKICHQIVMSPDIAAEWDRHQSHWARTWRVSMVARKKLCRVNPSGDTELQDRVVGVAAGDSQREAMLKDYHLIEAALATDQCIASLDDTARDLFARAARQVKELRGVAWVNPFLPDEQPIPWLAGGARPEKTRLLGSRPET